MPTTADKRTRLVQAAVELAHRRGFGASSLAEIAAAADVPVGNVYYYFKTKEDLGAAVVEVRCNEYRARRAAWDELGDARARLAAFVRFSLDIRDELTRSGCPIGGLCGEVQKAGGALASDAAELFTEMLAWAGAQFGRAGVDDPDGAALHLISMLQGATVLAHSLGSPDPLEREAERALAWLATL